MPPIVFPLAARLLIWGAGITVAALGTTLALLRVKGDAERERKEDDKKEKR